MVKVTVLHCTRVASWVSCWRELLENLGGEIWWLYVKVRVRIRLKSEYRQNRLSLTLRFQVGYNWHTSHNSVIAYLCVTRFQTAVMWSSDLGVEIWWFYVKVWVQISLQPNFQWNQKKIHLVTFSYPELHISILPIHWLLSLMSLP